MSEAVPVAQAAPVPPAGELSAPSWADAAPPAETSAAAPAGTAGPSAAPVARPSTLGPERGLEPGGDPAGQPVWADGAALLASLDASRRVPRASSQADDGWYGLDDVRAVEHALGAERARSAHGYADVAGSLVAYGLAGALARLVVTPLITRRQVVVPAEDGLRWRPRASGRPELVVEAATVAALPGDPVGRAQGGVVVPDMEALLDVAAGVLLEQFDPPAHAIRAQVAYGMRGMWGNLADLVAETVMAEALVARTGWPEAGPAGERAAWAIADGLVVRLGRRQSTLRSRPEPLPVAHGRHARVVVAKGACCIVYKSASPLPMATAEAARERIDATACTTCPLRHKDDRELLAAAQVAADCESGTTPCAACAPPA